MAGRVSSIGKVTKKKGQRSHATDKSGIIGGSAGRVVGHDKSESDAAVIERINVKKGLTPSGDIIGATAFSNPIGMTQDEYISRASSSSSTPTSTAPAPVSSSRSSSNTSAPYTNTVNSGGYDQNQNHQRDTGLDDDEYTDITDKIQRLKDPIGAEQFRNPFPGTENDGIYSESGGLQAPEQTGMPEPGTPEWDAFVREKGIEEAKKAQQTELQNIKRQGDLFKRGQEDLDLQKERGLDSLDRQEARAEEDSTYRREQYRKNVKRNIIDTNKQKEETLQRMRKLGGVMGLNVVSTFDESYKNTVDKFDRVVDRLNQDHADFQDRTGVEDKRLEEDFNRASEQLLEDYFLQTNRLQENFDFQMRDYKQQALLDANALVEDLGLSDEKLGVRLRDIGLSTFNLVNEAYGSYIDNQQKATDLLDSQAQNVIDMRKSLRDDQRAVMDEFLAGSANRTIVELNAMVANGQLSEGAADMMVGEIVQNSIDTLDTNFAPGIGAMFQDAIVDGINAGKTPNQVIQEIVTSPEFKTAIKDIAANDPFFETKLKNAQLQNQKAQQDMKISQSKETRAQEEYDIETGKVVPEGNIVLHNETGRALDSVAMPSFESAYDALMEAGHTDMVFAPGHRDQVQTIMQMAEREGVIFNEENPNATAAKLRSMGHNIADVGKSLHENGMAIDIYANGHYNEATPEQVDILNQHGFYQSPDLPGDKGHFEYVGELARGGSIGDFTVQEEGSMLDLMAATPNARLDIFKKDPELSNKYYNYKAQRDEKYKEHSDLMNIYYSTLDLGVGISDADREFITYEFDNALKDGDREGMKSAIYRGVLVKNNVNKAAHDVYKTLVANINVVQEAIQNLEDTGGDTGFLKGTFEEISQRIGVTTDPYLSTIKSAADFLSVDYLLDTSGTAVSDTERDIIKSMLPDIKKSSKLNEVISDVFVDRAKNQVEQGVRNTLGKRTPEIKELWDEEFAPSFKMVKGEDGIFYTQQYLDTETEYAAGVESMFTENPERVSTW